MKIDKKKLEKELGVITDTMLGIEDHGLFTFSIGFDFGTSSQGFGNVSLDTYDKNSDKRVGTAEGCEAIMRLLEAVGVRKWEDLVAKEMWVYREHLRGQIIGIESPAYRKAGRPLFLRDLYR